MTAATEQKPVTKMAQATKIFQEVYSKNYDLKGKSQRQCFIARAIDEIGMSKAGANTYFQNLSNKAKGEPLYKYNKYESKKGPEETKADAESELPGTTAKKPTRGKVKEAETQVAKGVQVDLTKRYQIKNGRGEVVNSFATKAPAEKYAAQSDKLSVLDTKAAEKKAS